MLAELNPHLDDQDQALLADHVARMDRKAGPRVGDFIRFACGTERRISYDWGDSVQTAIAGRFCIERGLADFSGSLFGPTPAADLTDTGQTQPGAAWFFHHGQARAHNGVDVQVPFRVFTSTNEATS